MSVKVTNHKTSESYYIHEVVNVFDDMKHRTLVVKDLFGAESEIDLKTFDVMILAK